MPIWPRKLAVYQDSAGVGIVKSGYQIGECRFAGAVRADQSHVVAGLYREIDLPQRLDFRAGICKRDVLEFDPVPQRLYHVRAGTLNLRLAVDDRIDAFGCRVGLLELVPDIAALANRFSRRPQQGDQRKKQARVDLLLGDPVRSEQQRGAPCEHAQNIHDGLGPGVDLRNAEQLLQQSVVDRVEARVLILLLVIHLHDLNPREGLLELA
jgi:hypothetical protein